MGGGVLCYSTHRGWASTADETQFWPRLGSDGSKGRLRTRFSPPKKACEDQANIQPGCFLQGDGRVGCPPPHCHCAPSGNSLPFCRIPRCYPKITS